MEVTGYILSALGGLLIGFPYLPFLKVARTVDLTGTVEPSEATGFLLVAGLVLLGVASFLELFELQGKIGTAFHPMPFKAFMSSVLLLVAAAIWRIVTAMASLFKAGSRALPLQLLGVLLTGAGIAVTVAHMLTKECVC